MVYTQKILPHYVYEDWEQWEGKWELIDGIAIAMSPAPIPLHQTVAGNIFYELKSVIKKTKCKRCQAYLPINYKIAEDTVIEPDISVVCGKIEKKYLDFPATMTVEVLSPATALRDRNTKYEIYRQQGVKYYLIVDPKMQTIEIYTLINGEYQLQPFTNTFSFVLDEDCEITPDFTEVWE
jgi:Uma2 family endonuclease